jgi:Domain of unknown function (DUF6285)
MSLSEHNPLSTLLAAVETLLRDRVIPAGTGDSRFAALMAASAIGMARRETELAGPLASAAADVAALAPQPSPFPTDAMALTHLIREGHMDGQDDAFRRLLTDAVIRTAVTRPRAVRDAERRLAGLE